jgi:hypothetical protein
MPLPIPNSAESEQEFVSRCMIDEKMKVEYPTEDQRYAICAHQFGVQLAAKRISFDYDGTFSTADGLATATELVNSGDEVYIISARSEVSTEMKARAARAGIRQDHIYATGSNKAKIEKVKELRIAKHYDNNPDVVKALGSIGKLI